MKQSQWLSTIVAATSLVWWSLAFCFFARFSIGWEYHPMGLGLVAATLLGTLGGAMKRNRKTAV